MVRTKYISASYTWELITICVFFRAFAYTHSVYGMDLLGVNADFKKISSCMYVSDSIDLSEFLNMQ